jgi:hypothetical protein
MTSYSLRITCAGRRTLRNQSAGAPLRPGASHRSHGVLLLAATMPVMRRLRRHGGIPVCPVVPVPGTFPPESPENDMKGRSTAGPSRLMCRISRGRPRREELCGPRSAGGPAAASRPG